jgi:hypothetical protein
MGFNVIYVYVLRARIATGYGRDDRGVGVLVPVGRRIFNFLMSFKPALGPTQPPI